MTDSLLHALVISKRFRRTPAEEYLPQLPTTEPRIQFLDRGVDQKQNEDPNLPGMWSSDVRYTPPDQTPRYARNEIGKLYYAFR